MRVGVGSFLGVILNLNYQLTILLLDLIATFFLFLLDYITFFLFLVDYIKIRLKVILYASITPAKRTVTLIPV